MRAVVVERFGGPDVVKIGDIARPEPASGQVLIRVAAAGVNPVDWKVREGYLKDAMPFSFPFALGSELAGTVEKLGEGVTGFKVGDAVHGLTGVSGAFAEYALAPANAITKRPDGLGVKEAATIPIAANTALAALDAGQVGKGTRILIHAASGGVGHIALQLARLRGAEVTALTSPGNIDFLRSLGAAHVIDRTTNYQKTIGNFDVVLDGYGPAAQERSWSLLKKGGILVSLVAPPSEEAAKAHGVRATMIFGGGSAAALGEFDKLVVKGDVKIAIARTYKFEEAVAALAEVQAGKVRGKLVLTVQ